MNCPVVRSVDCTRGLCTRLTLFLPTLWTTASSFVKTEILLVWGVCVSFSFPSQQFSSLLLPRPRFVLVSLLHFVSEMCGWKIKICGVK